MDVVMKPFLLVIVVLLAISSPVLGQTTQPSSAAPPPAKWEALIQGIAKSLVAGRNDTGPYLSDPCTIRSFNAPSKTQADLIAHTRGATLLMAKAYVFPGGAVASDIAGAVVDAAVPDDIKKALTPAEGEPTIRANATAGLWVQNAIGISEGDAYAVIVYANSESAQSPTAQGGVFFVLARGRCATDGSYLVTHIVYGDSQQATMTSAR